MVSIGKSLNRKTIAVLSDMNEPLGTEVGNANEVAEAIEVLRGGGEARLKELSITLAAHMAVAGGVYPDFAAAQTGMAELIASGQALATFRSFVAAQGGDPAIVDDPGKLPQAAVHVNVRAEHEGFVQAIDAEAIGIAAMVLGAGREKKEDTIDYAVGISLRKKVGDPIKFGDVIAIIHSNREQNQDICERILAAYTIAAEKQASIPIVHTIIE
jgi:thymidine phosphorylase